MMDTPKIFDSELKFCEILWTHEPVKSSELVRLCADELGWKKSTTYTFIKKLCANGIFKNENAIVSSVLNKEDYHRAQGEAFVEKAYGGFVTKLIDKIMQNKKLSAAQIAEIEAMIGDYKG